MAIRPILFSGPMVRALLAGEKTQTRRVFTRQPDPKCTEAFKCADGIWRFSRPTVGHPNCYSDDDRRMPIEKGDLLYVREAFRYIGDQATCKRLGDISFRASADDLENGRFSWKPGIHQPRWATRLTLEVTDVRVERVRDICDDDALAEGVVLAINPIAGRDINIDGEYWSGGPTRMFRELWNSLNAKRGFGWGKNPWVSATTFKVHRGNVDALADRLGRVV